MAKIKLVVSLAFFFVSAFIVAGCTATTNESESSKEGGKDTQGEKIITYSIRSSPITLDTNKVQDNIAAEILYHTNEGLLRSVNGEIIPGIAESWDVSDDGLTYVFHLRDSVWADGTPLTAEDFEYSITRYLNSETAAPFVATAYFIKNAEKYNKGKITDPNELGVKAIDKKTLEIVLENPDLDVIKKIANNFSLFPVRKDFVEQYGERYASDPEKIISNGPFKLVEWEVNSKFVLKKNEHYWNKEKINLDGITQLIVPDDNTKTNMYDTGQLDYLGGIPGTLVSNYPEHTQSLSGGLQLLQFNIAGSSDEAAKLTGNKNFRKALSYALNREAILKSVYGPNQMVAQRFVLPNAEGLSGAFVDEYPLESVPATSDEEYAKELLGKALDEINMEVNQLPSLQFLVMQGEQYKLVAEAMQNAWEKVLGLNNIEIKLLPPPQAIEAGMKREYDIYVQSFSGTDIVPLAFEFYTAGNSVNWTGWDDEGYNKMLTEAKKIQDPKKRLDALFEVEKYIVEHAPVEPFSFRRESQVSKEYVSGITTSTGSGVTELIFADIVR